LDADAEILGDDIENHIKNSQINSLLKDAIQKNKPLEAEVAIDGRVLLVNASPIRPKDSDIDNSGELYLFRT